MAAINEEGRTGKVYEKRIKADYVFSSFVESRMPAVDRKYMSKERPIASTTTGYDSANRNVSLSLRETLNIFTMCTRGDHMKVFPGQNNVQEKPVIGRAQACMHAHTHPCMCNHVHHQNQDQT